MRRLHSVSNEIKSDIRKQQQQLKRGGTAGGPRHAVVSDAPQDELFFYTQSLKETAAQQAKLEREYHQIIAANRRAIRQMHDENTRLRGIQATATDVTSAELEQLERRKFMEIRRLNRLTNQLERAEREIKDTEEVCLSKKDVCAKPLRGGVSGNGSIVLRIQKLEKKLDQMLTEQRRIEVIRKTYTEVLEEMEEKKNSSGSPVDMIELDIEARRRDYAKLVLMYNNALTDYRCAREELRKFNDTLQETRRLKDRTLAERRERVERALGETHRLELREVELQQEVEEEHQRAGDVLAEREMRAQRRQRSISAMERLTMAASIERGEGIDYTKATVLSHGISPGDEERVQAYENSFRRMMRATESSTVDTLITKFELEYAARLQLKNQIREEESRLEQLRVEVQNMKAQTEQRLLCGTTQTPVTLKLREDLTVFIEDASRERDVAMEKSVRLQELLSEVTQCVDVLANNLASYRSDVHIPSTRAENLVTNIQLVEQKIFSLADETVHRGESQPSVDTVLVVVPTSNTRVKLPTTSSPNNIWAPGFNATRSDGLSDTDVAVSGIVPSVTSREFDVSVRSAVSDDVGIAKNEDPAVSLLDNDEPLSREQVKRLAAVVLRREMRHRQREEQCQ